VARSRERSARVDPAERLFGCAAGYRTYVARPSQTSIWNRMGASDQVGGTEEKI